MQTSNVFQLKRSVDHISIGTVRCRIVLFKTKEEGLITVSPSKSSNQRSVVLVSSCKMSLLGGLVADVRATMSSFSLKFSA